MRCFLDRSLLYRVLCYDPPSGIVGEQVGKRGGTDEGITNVTSAICPEDREEKISRDDLESVFRQ